MTLCKDLLYCHGVMWPATPLLQQERRARLLHRACYDSAEMTSAAKTQPARDLEESPSPEGGRYINDPGTRNKRGSRGVGEPPHAQLCSPLPGQTLQEGAGERSHPLGSEHRASTELQLFALKS